MSESDKADASSDDRVIDPLPADCVHTTVPGFDSRRGNETSNQVCKGRRTGKVRDDEAGEETPVTNG